MYEYRCKLMRVVDGDTFDLEIDLGLHVFKRERVRLYGVDSPEIYGVKKFSPEWVAGMESKEKAETWFGLPQHNNLFVRTLKDKRGKYGRWLATVVNIGPDGMESNLNDYMNRPPENDVEPDGADDV